MQKDLYFEDGVSVVIVTYNGSERLVPTLDFLSKQENIHFKFEILVVDNNSTDSTSKKTYEIWEELGKPFKINVIKEITPGSMYARKKGIENSSFRYILFCDDDNWLNPGYVSQAYEIIRNKSEIAAVGGMGIMEYEKDIHPPRWLKNYEKNFGCGPQGKSDGDTTDVKGCLYSAGAIFDKVWLEKLDTMGFCPTLDGRNKTSLLGGEDTELTFALKLIGGRLYFSSELWFKHYMPKERLEWPYLKKLWRSFGSSNFIISAYNDGNESLTFKNLLVKEYRNLKRIMYLYIQFLIKSPREGDHKILEQERKIGELKAFVTAFDKFQSNTRQVKELRSRMKGRI